MCSNDSSNRYEGSISIENCTDLVVEAKISGCVDEMLSDSGTEISLLDEQLRKRCKNHFIQRPILPVGHTRIKSGACVSPIIEKQAIKTKYEQGTEIHATVLGVRKLGHNIIWEVDKLNKQHATFEFLKETLQGKVDSVQPVSYTHLDVYKRQVFALSRNPLTEPWGSASYSLSYLSSAPVW